MLFTLEMYDTNQLPTTHEGQGTLNADYATRMKIFMELYNNSVDYSKGYTKFEHEKVLGDCGKFPYGYVSKDEKEDIKFMLANRKEDHDHGVQEEVSQHRHMKQVKEFDL